MQTYIQNTLSCSYNALVRTIDHDGIEHAGYMSFMVLLSICPFLVFFLAITSFFGASEIGESFVLLLVNNMPDNTIDVVRARITEISKTPPQSLMTLAILGTIWTSSSFLESLRTILNRAYYITSPPTYIFRRMMSIAQFLIITMLIGFAMMLFVVVPIILSKIPMAYEFLQGNSIKFARYSLIFVSLFFCCSALYYIIPNTKIRFKEIIPGAIATVILWVVVGNLFFKYIIYYRQLSIVYGSLGSIILTLLFFYIINFIFIYGAEFNYLYNNGAKDEKDS